MTLPDPKKGWREALLRVWLEEPDSNAANDWALAYWIFCCGYCFPALMFIGFGPLSPWCLMVIVPIAYPFWWRLHTRPRMPTIWESTAGAAFFILLPAVKACRGIAGWVREASEEAAEHDRGEP